MAPALVAAARLVAERLSAGGRLLAHGEGRCAADAQHIAVEFLHPVITGRRALPALVGTAGRTPDDVVVSVAYGEAPVAAGAEVVLTDRAAAVLRSGSPGADLVLTDRPAAVLRSGSPDGDVVLTDRTAAGALPGSPGADVVLTDRATAVLRPGSPGAAEADASPTDRRPGAGAAAAEPVVVALPPGPGAKEAAVVAYHVLWEMAHVFLEADTSARAALPARQADPAMTALYPMLYAPSTDTRAGELTEAALASVRAKLAESEVVRAQARRDNAAAIERAAEALRDAPTIFTCGNGGSATDAADLAHLLGERGRSLSSDIATVTALANDVDFDVAFARPLATLGRRGDAVVGISTSGSSANVLAALAGAKARGLAAVGLAGYGGGRMVDADLDALLVVHSDSVHRIQEAQVCLYSEVATRSQTRTR